MITQLINRPAVLVKRSASSSEDELGNAIPGETLITTTVEIQQKQRDEHDDAVSDADWVGFFQPDETLDSGDSLLVDDQRFELVGDPWEIRDPWTGEISHVEATLRRTAGPEDAS